jgi:DNA-binding transcriptional MerR regulator
MQKNNVIQKEKKVIEKVYSIGQLSKLTMCKVPTIRYYENIEILPQANRSLGNQRRYNKKHLQRLQFIRHSRTLGFSLEEVKQLIHLQECSAHSPHQAHEIAQRHLQDVQQKISQLTALAQELSNIVDCCHHDDDYECRVLEALG